LLEPEQLELGLRDLHGDCGAVSGGHRHIAKAPVKGIVGTA